MKHFKQEFCMQQFKPAIAVMAILIVTVVGWTLWRQCPGSFIRNSNSSVIDSQQNSLVTVAAALKPSARNIDVNAKSPHPYLGVCNQCHITIGVRSSVSKIPKTMGQPISIKQKLPHQYWGNCMLCHKVKNGWQANGQFISKVLPVQVQAQTAGLAWLTAASLGFTVQPVNEIIFKKLKLIKERGLLVVAVEPGSLADKIGFQQGDEIVRINKEEVFRVDQLEAIVNQVRAKSKLTFVIYRGKDARKLRFVLPNDIQ